MAVQYSKRKTSGMELRALLLFLLATFVSSASVARPTNEIPPFCKIESTTFEGFERGELGSVKIQPKSGS